MIDIQSKDRHRAIVGIVGEMGKKALVSTGFLWFRGIMVRNAFLQERYDALWSGTREKLLAGAVEIDPLLDRKAEDRRRGMTLVIRPSAAVRDRVTVCLEHLRAIEPGLYYYHPAEFHVTFLSLFTATPEPERFFARRKEFQAAIEAVIPAIPPFAIEFSGITASPGAIMIQGFTDAEVLTESRDKLRRELHARGLAERLDTRYRLETAHMTVVRFRQPLRDASAFVHALDHLRAAEFGTSEVQVLEWVRNDWYMSRDITERLERFSLPDFSI